MGIKVHAARLTGRGLTDAGSWPTRCLIPWQVPRLKAALADTYGCASPKKEGNGPVRAHPAPRMIAEKRGAGQRRGSRRGRGTAPTYSVPELGEEEGGRKRGTVKYFFCCRRSQRILVTTTTHFCSKDES